MEQQEAPCPKQMVPFPQHMVQQQVNAAIVTQHSLCGHLHLMRFRDSYNICVWGRNPSKSMGDHWRHLQVSLLLGRISFCDNLERLQPDTIVPCANTLSPFRLFLSENEKKNTFAYHSDSL